MTVRTLLHRLAARVRRDDKGAAFAEYGLLAAGIAVVVAAAVWALGGAVVELYDLPARSDRPSRDFINREEEARRSSLHTRMRLLRIGRGCGHQEIHLSMNIIQFLQAFVATRREDDKGAAMVEYGILVAGIAVLVMAAVFALGGRIDTLFDGITL
jgi:pilus assembly protein Flp/PilA